MASNTKLPKQRQPGIQGESESLLDQLPRERVVERWLATLRLLALGANPAQKPSSPMCAAQKHRQVAVHHVSYVRPGDTKSRQCHGELLQEERTRDLGLL